MNRILLFISLLSVGILAGCHKDNTPGRSNAVVVKLASKVKAENVEVATDGTYTYTLNTLFHGYRYRIPEKYSKDMGLFCAFYFFREQLDPGLWPDHAPFVTIETFEYKDVEYTHFEQIVDRICIDGLDEALGLGTVMDIPLEQGKYNGGNDTVASVSISVTKVKLNHAIFDIVITTKAGDTISIYSDSPSSWFISPV